MSGRVALVTGGAGGIGSATARRLAGGGARVVIADVDADRGVAVAEECGGRFVRADLGTVRGNERAVAAAVTTFGRLDVVVLNAGVAGRCGLTDFAPRRYRDTMRVNLDGVVYGIEACLPHLRRPAGIVVVASMAGLTGSPDVFYAAGKYAQVGLVRSAAPVLAERGIRINVVCPGLVDSPAVASVRSALREHGLRLAHPDEVAAGIETILAGDGTGQAWVIQADQPLELIEPPDIPLAREVAKKAKNAKSASNARKAKSAMVRKSAGNAMNAGKAMNAENVGNPTSAGNATSAETPTVRRRQQRGEGQERGERQQRGEREECEGAEVREGAAEH